MKMSKLLQAISPLQKLACAELPLTVAYKLKKLFDKLQTDIDFYSQEIAKGTDEKKLLNCEIDNYEKVSIPLVDVVKLSVNDLEALEPFVDWNGNGGNWCDNN